VEREAASVMQSEGPERSKPALQKKKMGEKKQIKKEETCLAEERSRSEPRRLSSAPAVVALVARRNVSRAAWRI
jgi:hypothetical protein